MNKRSHHISLRAIFACTAAVAFLVGVVHWPLSERAPLGVVLVHLTPWAIGSLAGTFMGAKPGRSMLFWTVAGGIVGMLCFPASFLAYFGGIDLLRERWRDFAFGLCGSAILAAAVGIPLKGIKWSHVATVTKT